MIYPTPEDYSDKFDVEAAAEDKLLAVMTKAQAEDKMT